MIERILAKRQYRILSKIGEGAQGRVYCVQRTGDERFYACKVIRSREAWEREVYFLQLIQNEAFPHYHESWWQSGVGMVIMEYAEGQSLDEFVRHRKSVTERQMYAIASDVAEALAYLHQKNPPLLFRDLKPSNIRIMSNGRVKLVDLGAVCQMKEDEKSTGVGHGARSFAGTPAYAAPEQFNHGESVGEYSDVYAFGKLLNYLLEASGKRKRRSALQRRLDCWQGLTVRWQGLADRWQGRKIRQRMKRIAAGCVRTEKNSRFPDMHTVFCKLRNEKRIIYNVCYEKNICIYNSD